MSAIKQISQKAALLAEKIPAQPGKAAAAD